MNYKIFWLIWGVAIISSILFAHPAQANAPQETEIIPAVLERIAMCESRNNEDAKNSHSSASGRFQFIASSWKYYGTKLWGESLKNKNVFDYWDNTELAIYVYELNGTKDWYPSRSCWGIIK